MSYFHNEKKPHAGVNLDPSYKYHAIALDIHLSLTGRHTHDLRIHQLQVRVSGWEQVSPVSVDKVGIYFRYAAPDKSTSSSTVSSTSLKCC